MMTNQESTKPGKTFAQALFSSSPPFFLNNKIAVQESAKKSSRNYQLLGKISPLSPEEITSSLQNLPHALTYPPTTKADNPRHLLIMFLDNFKKSGEHFAEGASGELLQKMISAMRILPYQYAVSSSVTKEGQENFDLQNIINQIFYLRPQIVVTLGTTAPKYILGEDSQLNRIHGKFFPKKIISNDDGEVNFIVCPIFHPDYLLINPDMKKTTWSDMQKIMKELGKKFNK